MIEFMLILSMAGQPDQALLTELSGMECLGQMIDLEYEISVKGGVLSCEFDYGPRFRAETGLE